MVLIGYLRIFKVNKNAYYNFLKNRNEKANKKKEAILKKC